MSKTLKLLKLSPVFDLSCSACSFFDSIITVMASKELRFVYWAGEYIVCKWIFRNNNSCKQLKVDNAIN